MERGINFPNGADAAAAAVPGRTAMELVQQRFKSDETVHLVSGGVLNCEHTTG